MNNDSDNTLQFLFSHRNLKKLSRRSKGRKSAWVLSLLVIAAAIAVWVYLEDKETSYKGTGELDYAVLAEQANQLEVRTAHPAEPYSREKQFGEPWVDAWDTGCDTRNYILQRDLQNTQVEGSCKVLSGTLDDPYTGGIIDFERGERSSEVQIDHIVPLKDAWDSGAFKLTQDERVRLANDPDNLLAVDGPSNQEKSAQTLDQWQPENPDFVCDYAGKQVLVKQKYGLTVTQDEKNSMVSILESCQGTSAME